MTMDHFSSQCQNCGATLLIERLRCPACALVLEGELQLPRLARLSAEDRRFIELFVLSAGSLKEVGRTLQLSYPTIRAQLDGVISRLQDIDRHAQEARLRILQMLENKEISPEAAAKLLAQS